jgi:GNAT superfamily N-acetyltransferase
VVEFRYPDVEVSWRGEFSNNELNALHAAAFGHGVLDDDWRGQVERHSLGWVTTRVEGDLVGFVNVPWDGGVHAFLIDTIVAPSHQRRGIGASLVEAAVRGSREAGCEWLHVDFDDDLCAFYFGACGFEPTPAGLISL